MDEPIIDINPAFKGFITPADLLLTTATLLFETDSASLQQNGLLFRVLYKDFIFILFSHNNSLVIKRNEVESALSLDELVHTPNSIDVFVSWTTNTISLDCNSVSSSSNRKRASVPTRPFAPPIELIRWARKNNLVEVPNYDSEEAFRVKVNSCLSSINDKIREADAFISYWDLEYKGQKIISRTPKKEVTLQPLIKCLLSDQMLQSNIELIPEYKSGEGNLDFLFLANVSGVGMSKICAEFKLAHSVDLERGLLAQLPAYMDISKAKYGVYCILNFKGAWFNKPTFKRNERLDMYMQKVKVGSGNPVLDNVRIIILNMFKPDTASKH